MDFALAGRVKGDNGAGHAEAGNDIPSSFHYKVNA